MTPTLAQEAQVAQVRRVRHVIRSVDAMTVLKFSGLFYLSLYIVLLVAGIVLWSVASVFGVIDNIEDFTKELFGFEQFSFRAGVILRGSLAGGLIVVLIGTGMNLLAAVLYNLIADVVGGVEVSIVEEETRRVV